MGEEKRMTDREKRKEWLEKQINELEDKSLFAELSKQDQLWLDCYHSEYEVILEQESNNNVRTERKTKNIKSG